MRALPRRLAKYGLRLNERKTHLVAFGKRYARQCLGTGQSAPTLDFLGLTHYWGRSRRGQVRLKRKTSKKRFRRALKQLKLWLKRVCSVFRLPVIWQSLGLKLRGHFNYFGVTDNSHALKCFVKEVRHLVFKCLNRRSQRRSFTWASFQCYEARHPLPRPRRLVSLHSY